MSHPPWGPGRLRDAALPGEGTIFGLPIPAGEYVLGVVIERHTRTMTVGVTTHPVDTLSEWTGRISRSDVAIVTRVACGALDDGRWPVVGLIEDFDAQEWPNPPSLPGERGENVQGPGDLEREIAKAVQAVRRPRAAPEEGLIPVERDQGRRYAELVLGHGSLLARMVLDTVDLNRGSYVATLPFIEETDSPAGSRDGTWYTGAGPEFVMEGGWVQVPHYALGLVPTLQRLMADETRSVVFDFDRLDLAHDAMRAIWKRIETERHGPLRMFPLQVFFRDEGTKRETYAAAGGPLDAETSADILKTTYNPVIHVAFVLEVDVNALPPHAHPVEPRQLEDLAGRVKGLAVRWTSYDGYLIWEADGGHPGR